jgi:hypothetical protein
MTKHADFYPPFPKQNRRAAALVAFFNAQGVPSAQVVYLQDRQATTRNIQQSLEAQLAAARAGDLLVGKAKPPQTPPLRTSC